jgi:dihydropteroate synthase
MTDAAGTASCPPAPLAFAGLDLDRPRIMGVVNVTPDSFSDGGDAYPRSAAIDRALALHAAGAAIIDVGGESTRPGAEPVPVEEELARVIPVIKELAGSGVLVSIDTRRAAVMEAAIEVGASVVNDVSGLAGDAGSIPLMARSQASVVLMHMQGDPRTMQAAPRYDDVVRDVCDWLRGRIAACETAGIAPTRLAVDPGIGFGKTLEHNLTILAHLDAFAGLGRPVVLGVSRKSFIARLSRDEPPKDRLPGSLAAGLLALLQGVHILRVHDVGETRQALAVWQAILDKRFNWRCAMQRQRSDDAVGR